MTDNTVYPPLSAEAIDILESRGCSATDWNRVRIDPASDLSLFTNVEFEGDVEIGCISSATNPRGCLRNLLISGSRIGAGVRLRYIPGGIINAEISEGVTIENCASVSYDNHPSCGVGVNVSVLDETGSREVTIYPGISAQAAMIMARGRREDAGRLRAMADAAIDSGEAGVRPLIAARAYLSGCGPIHNVAIGHDVRIEGALALSDGAIINNAPEGESSAYVGHGVDAKGFIIEDAVVDSGALLRNCYVGQGVRIGKHFTAHDSLFFANCAMENGEACALFAGPYSVSMHKGTLLIGCQTSFMNAGSSTNQSNHMYKLGPVHWGVLERGVKTSSGSYLMLGANIGAFSLLMGQHKTHPDSSEFPFSYLFGDASGATVVVPGVMLRSCGLLRDEQKWPSRDNRLNHDIRCNDRVICDVLNPVTVDAMIRALDTIRPMLGMPADDDRFLRYKGMKLSRASLERALKLYRLGILKYLSRFIDPENPQPIFSEIRDADDFHPEDADKWVDLAGLPLPRKILDEALEKESLEEIEDLFGHAYDNYKAMQREWLDSRIPGYLRLKPEEIMRESEEYDLLVEQDRRTYRNALSAETAMLRL